MAALPTPKRTEKDDGANVDTNNETKWLAEEFVRVILKPKGTLTPEEFVNDHLTALETFTRTSSFADSLEKVDTMIVILTSLIRGEHREVTDRPEFHPRICDLFRKLGTKKQMFLALQAPVLHLGKY